MEDNRIVTLLDGTKISKNEVPIGVIYINEKGQKVKKVVKTSSAEKTNLTSKEGGLFSSISRMGKNVADSVSNTTASVGKTITSTTKKLGDSTTDFAMSTIMKLLKGVNIQSLIDGVEKYGKSSGKNVSATVKFLNKLINLQKNGK